MIPSTYSLLCHNRRLHSRSCVTVRSRETSGSNPMANCSPLLASDEEVIRQDAFSSLQEGSFGFYVLSLFSALVQLLPRGHKP